MAAFLWFLIFFGVVVGIPIVLWRKWGWNLISDSAATILALVQAMISGH